MAANNTLEFDSATFDQEVLNSEVPVLVDFWATWCGPCKAMTPTIDAVGEAFAGRAKVGKVEADANPELLARYGITSVPTLLFFQGGKVVDQFVGAVPARTLIDRLDELTAANAS